MLKKLSSLTLLLVMFAWVQQPSAHPPTRTLAAFSHEIKGLVKDSSGTPLPGATIKVKNNNTIGTATDVNGRYILVVPDDAIVVVSMIGFEAQEMSTRGKSTIDFVLVPAANSLGETVVVAYGTQKRKEVVGSMTTINVDQLKVPTSNLTTALAGRAAGLIAFQTSGEPGQDNANFFVRGVTTFGYKKDPLILIDGVELTTEDLARLRPDDIESFSIMKDATSTALYGARGANGVILVTTKKGIEGPAKLALRVENSFSAPTKEVELADPITYMKLANEAQLTRDALGILPYSDEKIDGTAAGKNPLVYPRNDWYNQLFKDYTTSQRANVNVRGGGTVARYFVSGSFTKDNGILKVDKLNNFNNNIDIKRYTIRANVDVDLTKSTLLTVRTSGNFDDYQGPLGSGATSGGAYMYALVMHSNPVRFPAVWPRDNAHQYVQHIMFGNTEDLWINPYAEMVRGYRDESRSFMSAQMEVRQQLDFLLPGLTLRSLVNTNRTSNFSLNRSYNPFYYGLAGYDPKTDSYGLVQLNPNTGTEYLNYNPGSSSLNSVFYWETALSYNRSFGNHNVSGMLINIMRNRIDPNKTTLQESLPARNTGVSGRVTYNYDYRYMAEFNFGYNGSEKFFTNHRFGFFPSAGVAWSVSNEEFFKPLVHTITNMKLRATYGVVGNDAIGAEADRFFYLSQVNPNDAGKGATFGRDNTTLFNGYSISRYSNIDITWEESYQKNIALEMNLLNKLNFVGEYYTSKRKHILMDRASIPATMGLGSVVPKANVGQAESKGVDLSLNYNDHFKNGMWFELMSNFTYATGKFTVYEEPQYLASEWYRSRVGWPINQRWGYIAERLFIDDEEAANSPTQNFGTRPQGGDIKYTDVNRDGQITSADMVPIGYPTTPEITYGFGFSAGHKGFDLSAFFQGSGRSTFFIDASSEVDVNAGRFGTAPFVNQTQLLKAYADDHWSEDNRNVNALWPRLSPTENTNNSQTSTWFMRNGSFLRLKQVEVGYSLPKHMLSRFKVSSFRFYLNGTNLLTLSHFKLWDVEMGGNGLGYPIQRVMNVGLNITFN